MRAIQGQRSGKGPGIGFLKEVLKVEAGLGAGKSPPPLYVAVIVCVGQPPSNELGFESGSSNGYFSPDL
jgi:hypothetical protein